MLIPSSLLSTHAFLRYILVQYGVTWGQTVNDEQNLRIGDVIILRENSFKADLPEADEWDFNSLLDPRDRVVFHDFLGRWQDENWHVS